MDGEPWRLNPIGRRWQRRRRTRRPTRVPDYRPVLGDAIRSVLLVRPRTAAEVDHHKQLGDRLSGKTSGNVFATMGRPISAIGLAVMSSPA
jgi:hypothetical protein